MITKTERPYVYIYPRNTILVNVNPNPILSSDLQESLNNLY